jgi:hypothetical protein
VSQICYINSQCLSVASSIKVLVRVSRGRIGDIRAGCGFFMILPLMCGGLLSILCQEDHPNGERNREVV